jgi:hypothetical protein
MKNRLYFGDCEVIKMKYIGISGDKLVRQTSINNNTVGLIEIADHKISQISWQRLLENE